MKHALLATHALTKTFTFNGGTLNVLRGITMQFQQGKTYAITGVSGTGKSTYLHLLAGLEIPTSGAVYLNNKAIPLYQSVDRFFFLNRSVGLVFQYPYLIRELSVQENVMLPGLIAGQSRHSCAARADELLHQVGIPEKTSAMPGQLSGGQQQRVAIARALFNKPLFLLADEPTGNLDIETGKAIVDLLIKCQKEYGMGIIVSTHDEYVAKHMMMKFTLKDGILQQI